MTQRFQTLNPEELVTATGGRHRHARRAPVAFEGGPTLAPTSTAATEANPVGRTASSYRQSFGPTQ